MACNILIRVVLLLTVSLLFLVSCGEATAPPAANNVVKQTPEQELEALKKKAETGDAEMQFSLGMAYLNGQYGIKDSSLAFEWLNKAAEQGHIKAQVIIGKAYQEGKDVPENLAKAGDWFQKAADKGDPEAQFSLSKILSDKDRSKSNELMKKSADQGYAEAQYWLGNYYSWGNEANTGFEKDLAKALSWFQKAADQGYEDAIVGVASSYYWGLGAPKDAAKAFEWAKKAAIKGNAIAQQMLGRLYLDGDGVPKDLVLAYAWFNLGVANDNSAQGRKFRDTIPLSQSQRAEAQRLSSQWKNGELLTRDGSNGVSGISANADGALVKIRTGTGFVVGKEGQAITNFHIVDGCREVRVVGRNGTAQVTTRDTVNDIALVQVPGAVTATATINENPANLRQGEEIVVYGFPLSTVLSSNGNLTPGVVSALTGVGNNTNQIQITAPIQPGSSGSPVLNKKGEIVGVVSMKLSDSDMAKATGQIGQNINFAINGMTLKTFLDTHQVVYRTSSFVSFEKNNVDLADEARKWTLILECWK